MTISIASRFAPVALTGLLCMPALAYAQATSTAPATTMPPAATAPAASGAAMNPAMNKDREAKVEQRINQLHAQLHITQAEESQWKAFADVMRVNAVDMDQAVQRRAEQYPSMNALQNMQSYEKLAQTHAEHLQILVSAFETLYNALPATQKQAADLAFRAKMEAQPEHAAVSSGTRTQ